MEGGWSYMILKVPSKPFYDSVNDPSKYNVLSFHSDRGRKMYSFQSNPKEVGSISKLHFSSGIGIRDNVFMESPS